MTYTGSPQISFGWPPLTSAVRLLIWINLIVAILNLLTAGWVSSVAAVSPSQVVDWYGLGVVRLVTTCFVHSLLDPWHLLGNMLGLYIFGTMIEHRTGRVGLLRLYLIAGVIGSIFYVLVEFAMGRDNPAVGASGSVFGIMCFAAAADPQRIIRLFFILPVQLGWLVGIILFLGLWGFFLDVRLDLQDGVAHAAHLGGAGYGFLAYYKLRRLHDTPTEYLPPGRDGFFGIWKGLGERLEEQKRKSAERAARRERERAAQVQEKLDELLEKVKKQGMDSLTPAERKFLQKASESMRR